MLALGGASRSEQLPALMLHQASLRFNTINFEAKSPIPPSTIQGTSIPYSVTGPGPYLIEVHPTGHLDDFALASAV